MKYLALLLLLGSLSLTACDKGVGERIGENIDGAANQVGNAVEDACENITNRPC